MTVAGQFNVDDPLTVSRKLNETVDGVGVAESVIFTVNWKVPVAVGVPEMVALGEAEFSARPAGIAEPVPRLHVYGRTPPVAVSWVLYAELSVAPGSGLVVVIFRPLDAVLIVMLRACVDVCAGDSASVAWTVKDEVALVVGVPEITPALESANPAGSVPLATLHVYGVTPPVAASV